MFPIGIYSYIAGGLIIGIGVSFIYILTGIHATQSSFLSTSISYFSENPYFQRKNYLNSRQWRLLFAAGVISGAFLYTIILSNEGFWITKVQLWRLIVGGFFVGFGTRLSSGCTSGHGISGVASLSATSVYAVITFIATGVIVSRLMTFMGVVP